MSPNFGFEFFGALVLDRVLEPKPNKWVSGDFEPSPVGFAHCINANPRLSAALPPTGFLQCTVHKTQHVINAIRQHENILHNAADQES